jgi:hypothetical protein
MVTKSTTDWNRNSFFYSSAKIISSAE